MATKLMMQYPIKSGPPQCQISNPAQESRYLTSRLSCKHPMGTPNEMMFVVQLDYLVGQFQLQIYVRKHYIFDWYPSSFKERL